MQDGWERRQAHLALDPATLAALLRPVLPGHRLVAVEPLAGGLVNTNYKVTLSGLAEPVVVRVYARDLSACRKEDDIFRLAHSRVPMSDVLFADTTGAAAFGRPYMVTRWVEGIKLDAVLMGGDVEAIAAAATAVGATLADIGRFTFPASGFFGPGLTIAEPLGSVVEVCPAYIHARLFDGHAAERLGAELARDVWALVSAHAELLHAVDSMTVLVQGDYKAQNLLVRRAGVAWETAAVLDWEFAYAGMPLFDLGILLRYSELLPPAFEAGVLAGFVERGGVLPADWKRVTKLLDLMNLCGFLDTPEPRGRMTEEVTALVRATVERWSGYGQP